MNIINLSTLNKLSSKLICGYFRFRDEFIDFTIMYVY